MANNNTKPIPALTESAISRFWSKVDKTPGLGPKGQCWIWNAGRFATGYGCICIGQRSFLAHRVAFKLLTGEDPIGLEVCHSCDNPACVRCLWKGTRKENHLDMAKKGRGPLADKNGRRTHPERTCRGDRHWARSRPWELAGSKNPNCSLNENAVSFLRTAGLKGDRLIALGRLLGISKTQTYRVIRGDSWRLT